MANIGATTAFYKVETSLTKANQEVSKSMERLATGKQNANAGDRSSYVAMADTFRLDYVGTKAGIKGASVVMGYLETGMRVLDSASSLLSRMQELAVLGANATNTTADHEAINLEAEALADEFNRLMSSATYKGKPVFVSSAGSEYVSLGGRDAEMTFGIGTIDYTALYSSTAVTNRGGPNDAVSMNLKHLPSDAVAAKKFGNVGPAITAGSGSVKLLANKTYRVTTLDNGSNNHLAATPGSVAEALSNGGAKLVSGTSNSTSFPSTLAQYHLIKIGSSDISVGSTVSGASVFTQVADDINAFVAGSTYEIVTVGSDTDTSVDNSDAKSIALATADIDTSSTLTVGTQFTVDADANYEELAEINSLSSGITFKLVGGTNQLTRDIEAVQALVNGARVEAGSQYAAIESAVQYTTDLTAQYELGYNTVNDVNFSMETAHLAKNQILQQAATAMLAQANQGQQGLLMLIQN